MRSTNVSDQIFPSYFYCYSILSVERWRICIDVWPKGNDKLLRYFTEWLFHNVCDNVNRNLKSGGCLWFLCKSLPFWWCPRHSWFFFSSFQCEFIEEFIFLCFHIFFLASQVLFSSNNFLLLILLCVEV